MSSLEEMLSKQLDADSAASRKAEEQKEAGQRREQEQKAKFYPSVTEAVDEFPRLARKYGTATVGIEIYRKGLLGLGKQKRVRVQAWEMPGGVYLDPAGTFYRYDHFISSQYGARAGSIHERCTREEAIETICSTYCTQGIADFYDSVRAPQAIREYVQDLFVKCLTLKKTPDGHLYHGA